MNPTNQLVEAITHAMGECPAANHECVYQQIKMLSEEGAPSEQGKEAINAILLAIADAVDTQIGEDMAAETELDGDGGQTPVNDAMNLRAVGVNAEKARMRTFTAALRERAK